MLIIMCMLKVESPEVRKLSYTQQQNNNKMCMAIKANRT